jgi:HK97 family phage major capsid protein
MSTSLYERQAKAALEERSKLVAELRTIEADSKLTAVEKRERVERIDRDVMRLEAEARQAVERGEREAEVRSLAGRAGAAGFLTGSALPDDSESFRGLVPSLNEYRALTAEGTQSAGGWTVPEKVSAQYADILRSSSTLLRALPVSNVLTFDTDTLQVPQLIESGGEDYVAEGAELPEGTMTWSSLSFPARKIGRVQWASSEILEDSALDLRNIIGQNLLRDASLRFDADAFNGGLTDEVKGILVQGTSTSLAAGKVTVTYDDLADACARVESMNGHPSVVWASTDMGAALRKEKASGSGQYQGGSPTDSPASTAWGLPVMVSGFLPAKTVVVADASRLFVGIRRNAAIRISEDARFSSDQVGFKLTMRVAGVGVAESSSVQVIKAAAS